MLMRFKKPTLGYFRMAARLDVFVRDWDTTSGADASSITVDSVSSTEIKFSYLGNPAGFFVVLGAFDGISGLDLSGLTGTVSSITLSQDALGTLVLFSATGLALDVRKVTPSSLVELPDLLEEAFGDGGGFHGSGGDDSLHGGVGDDSIDGGSGSDDLFGGDGDDGLSGGSGDDSLDGGAGDDSVDGGGGDDTLFGAAGFDHLRGGDGADYLSGGGDGDTLDGGAGADDLLGGSGVDLLLGGSGNDTLKGDAGNDTLNGGVGVDSMAGGAGNDAYVIDSYNDRVTEGAGSGTDSERASITHTLEANIENLLLTGAGAINGTGNGGNNSITGNGANNRLNGGAGNDRLDGGAGNDTELGGTGTDTVVGGAGNDSLNGGSGIDTLVGGAGKDSMTGGTDSRDVFDFNAITETGRTSATADTINDFKHLVDKIDLSTIDANSGHAGNDAFTQLLSVRATFNQAGQLQLKGDVLYGNTDSDSAAEFAIHLTGVTSVSLGDFVL